MKKDVAKKEALPARIDAIVESCGGIVQGMDKTFMESMNLAHGIQQLRAIFEEPEIKSCVEAMKDTKLGFLTDRPPGTKQTPYPYEKIKECLIEGMLKGARLTGNEINIIAGGYYAAKAGKFRRINENPDIVNFQYTLGTPQYEIGQIVDTDGDPKTIQYAKVKCAAKWSQNGSKVDLGADEDDPCIIKVRVNRMMGEDAVVGKAESKLFSRVLTRITGRVEPESEDLDAPIPVAATVEDRPKPDKIEKEITAFDRLMDDLLDDPLLELYIVTCSKTFDVTAEVFKSMVVDDAKGFRQSFDKWKKGKASKTTTATRTTVGHRSGEDRPVESGRPWAETGSSNDSDDKSDDKSDDTLAIWSALKEVKEMHPDFYNVAVTELGDGKDPQTVAGAKKVIDHVEGQIETAMSG